MQGLDCVVIRTFPFSLTFFKYCRVSSLPTHQGMSTVPAAPLSSAWCQEKKPKHGVSDKSLSIGKMTNVPFGGSKACHPCHNASINQVLLGLVPRPRKELDKRQYGVFSSQSLDQGILVVVVGSMPVNPRRDDILGRWFLGKVSLENLLTEWRCCVTFRLRMVISCLFAASRASITSRATSGRDRRSQNGLLSLAS